VQLLNFSAFYGTRWFINVFTRALQWSLSWTRSIQSIPSYLHFNIVHPPTSWSSQWSLTFWLSHQYPTCIPLIPPFTLHVLPISSSLNEKHLLKSNVWWSLTMEFPIKCSCKYRHKFLTCEITRDYLHLLRPQMHYKSSVKLFKLLKKSDFHQWYKLLVTRSAHRTVPLFLKHYLTAIL
jgi:predicted glycosyl hydrolase (DUF1957 family)